ncbi:MAG: holo-ACP synthase [Candidatus Omnitrophota bacterium]|nr:holo-ACP synthase [Candidatus Omnitrophota bacterium]
MIFGSGIDIIETERIKQAIMRWGNGFLKHVFTEEEIDYAYKRRFPYQHFAARFAAKEAVLKAFGDNAHINWKDICIMNDKNGKPVCIYKDKKFDKEILISIAHTQNYAVASAIITKKS